VLQLLDSAYIVLISPIPFTVMMGTIRSPEMTVLTKATRRYIPEDDILQRVIYFEIAEKDHAPRQTPFPYYVII
jgi:hypothetical protein